MGIVLKQSLKNTMVTYIGFGFGALNTLFLYTQILEPRFYGLVTFILATGAILMPLMAFGMHNTMVKFYSGQKEEEKNAFLTLMLLGPLLLTLPLGVLTYFFFNEIGTLLSRENAIVKDYVWYVFLVGLAMAYFEVFFAWSRVHLKSVFGNFMKEVFVRAGVSILLGLLYFDIISLDFFLRALVGLYLLRTVLMKLYAYRLRSPQLDFNFPKNTRHILTYSLLIILGGSAALILLEIDKVMINQFMVIENVAYYGVAVYIATVIIVPSRAMHQITYPLTAELLNTRNSFELENLYKRTSLTLFIAAGLLFLLITLNLQDLYQLLPETYENSIYIVSLIGLAKVFDSFLGNINSILYNSEYYKTIFLFGICLALLTIVLNLWLIPLYGIEGAALASFTAIFSFNTIKMVFVKLKFGILPFSKGSLKVLVVLLLLAGVFGYVQLGWHPIINIALKSIVMVGVYVGLLYWSNASDDLNVLVLGFIKRKTP